MRAVLAALLACFASTLVYCAEPIEGETPRAEAIKANFDKLVSEDKEVKREALLYFGKVDKTFAAEVPLFTASLKDERNQVRAISAFALGKIGKAAAGSIAAVEKLLTDSSATVQKYAKRALERLRVLKPDPKRLTAEEATKLMALSIGEWEIKGESRYEGKAPEGVEFVDTIRWKKKGTSFEVLRVDTRTGRPSRYIWEQEYDPVSGQFIFRTIVRGEVVGTSRRDYDPANRTFTDTVISPKLPPGIRQEVLLVSVNDDKFTLSIKVYDEGRLVSSFQAEGNRSENEDGSSTSKLTPDEVIAALKKLGGRVNVDKNKAVLEGPKVTDAGLVHLAGLKSLESLRIAGDNVTDAGMVHLKGLTKLEQLSFNSPKITDAGLKHLKGLTKLKALGFDRSMEITDAGLIHLKGLTKLEYLVCNSAKVTDAGLVHLKGMPRLHQLALNSTKVTDAGLVHLKGLTNLEGLALGDTKVTDAGLEHLKGLTDLKMLSLGDTKVTDAGLEHLKGLTDLKMLDLDRNMEIADAGLIHLKGLTKLEHLDLRGTKVTDSGLVHLKGLTNLGRLFLAGTKVTDASLAHLNGLRNLRLLDLRDTKVTDTGLKKLKQALPKCGINR